MACHAQRASSAKLTALAGGGLINEWRA